MTNKNGDRKIQTVANRERQRQTDTDKYRDRYRLRQTVTNRYRYRRIETGTETNRNRQYRQIPIQTGTDTISYRNPRWLLKGGKSNRRPLFVGGPARQLILSNFFPLVILFLFFSFRSFLFSKIANDQL